MSGLVLLGCPREIQEAVAEQQAPAVVFGSVFATARSLSSADADPLESGRLMARCVVGRGHARIALLTRDVWLPGDNLLLDGINEALAKARLEEGALVIRSLPVDADLAATEVRDLLGQKRPPKAASAAPAGRAP